jgi:hypothetical protein
VAVAARAAAVVAKAVAPVAVAARAAAVVAKAVAPVAAKVVEAGPRP